MLKTIFLNVLKILFASILIFWLISSGKLDFNLLAKLISFPMAVFTALSLNLLNILLVSLRWESTLRARSQFKLPVLGLIQVSWIGQFFSSVLPGSVSGDLVKILYIQKYDKTFSKKFIFATILIDRLMGLAGLILLVGTSSLIFKSTIVQNAPAMEPLLQINFILMTLVVLALLIFFSFHQSVRKILVKLESLGLKGQLNRITHLWDDLVLIKYQMIKAIGLSLIIQLVSVLSFWSLIHPFIEGKMNFIQALTFIPVGFITLALPIAPSGLGVGHAIFQKLFELSSISNGASLFNLYFVVTLVVNLVGVIPYLVTRTKD